MKKRRAPCGKCGAKKYLKYMHRQSFAGPQGGQVWYCLNQQFCKERGPNYRK